MSKNKPNQKMVYLQKIISEKTFKTTQSLNSSIYKDLLGQYKNDYKIIGLLKKELISKIYEAENIKEQKIVSLKVYNKKALKKGDYDYFIEQIKREEEITKLCKSENIVNIYRKLETPENIIFEMDSWDMNLADYIERNDCGLLHDFYTFKEILLGITNALKVLNEKGVMHRDIKPSNIFLIGKSYVKLGGFNFSIYIKDNTFESVGSYFYAAPEIIKKLEYDEKCDLWSLGIILHEVLFKYLPYGKNVTINMIKQAIYYEDNFFFKETYNEIINKILKMLLVVNRKNRINHKNFFEYLYGNIFNPTFQLPRYFSRSNIKFFNKMNDIPHLKGEISSFNHHPNLDKCNKSLKESFLNRKTYPFKNMSDNPYLNGNEFLNKIIDIFEEGCLPDIMNFPNGFIDLMDKINNIIYYDENINFIDSKRKDCDYFEKKTSGAFILCNNMKSLELIKDEILKQIRKDKRIAFNLITSGSTCKKVMDYISQNKRFEDCIKNICIYCMEISKYQYLKIEYPKVHNDIYNRQKDVINFIINSSDINIKPYPITKLITFQEYKEKYKERHSKVSEFYGNIDLDKYEKFYKKISDLINDEEQNKELKKSKNKLLQSLQTFNIKNPTQIFEDFDTKKDTNEYLEYLDKLIIKEYTKNSLFGDLNKWLMNYTMNYYDYESVAYFTARLMYSLNSYAQKNKKFFTENKSYVYRGIKMPYSCLLPYERAKGKIILLSSFTSTSRSLQKVKSYSERDNSKELYKANLLFSVIFIIKNIWEEKLVSNGINVQNESAFKSEKEILYQPFSFYFVSDIKINYEEYTADINLETIGKTQILEEEIKKGKEVIYDKLNNIVKIKK